MAGDEGPIRVKGGSVFVEADYDWEPAPGGGFRLKGQDNPNRKFWSGFVVLDGVPSNQWNGRVVEIEIEANHAHKAPPKNFTCEARGGIRVKPATDLTMNGKCLENLSVFIKFVRVRGTPTPLDFGPFTAEDSKLLQVVMRAQGD